MEDCVNKNLDEIKRDITEHEIETNGDAMKMLIQKFPYVQDDDKKEEIAENKNKSAINRDITEKENNLIGIP